RIDERVGLRVVSHQNFGAGTELEFVALLHASFEQRWELVAELVLEGAEAELEQVLQIGLEGQLVVADAVEGQTLGQHPAHLAGTAAEDVNVSVMAGELSEQARGSGDGPLLVRSLEGGAQEIAERV